METQVVVDTDILIDFLTGVPSAIDWMEAHPELAISTITLFELYAGAFKSHRAEANIRTVDMLQERMHIFDVTTDVAVYAARFRALLERRGMPIEHKDLLIGATAAANGLRLKTHNKKHFERIPGLILET